MVVLDAEYNYRVREKACVHVHLENKHTRVDMETIVSLYTENICKVKRGSGGARAMLFILSQIQKHVFLLNQTRLSNGQA